MTFRVMLGVDPGQTGAIAVLVDGVFESFIDTPLMARPAGGHEINGNALAEALRDVRRRHSGCVIEATLEAVHAMPDQGVSGVFRFGEGFGILKGVLQALGIPYTLVPPQRWKKWASLIGCPKDAARTRCIERYPAAAALLHRKKDIGRADALLIGAWGVAGEITPSRPQSLEELQAEEQPF